MHNRMWNSRWYLMLFVHYLYVISKLKYRAFIWQKKRLIYHNKTSLNHLLWNKLNIDYFTCDINDISTVLHIRIKSVYYWKTWKKTMVMITSLTSPVQSLQLCERTDVKCGLNFRQKSLFVSVQDALDSWLQTVEVQKHLQRCCHLSLILYIYTSQLDRDHRDNTYIGPWAAYCSSLGSVSHRQSPRTV